MVGSAEEQRRPVPEEDEDPDRRDGADRRAERAAQAREGEARVEVLAVGLLEARPLALLEREAAHDAHAGEVGLEAVAHVTERRLVLAHAVVHPAREAARDEDDDGQVHEARDRERGAQLQHDLEPAREHEHHVDDVEDAEAEEHPHLLEVARRSAHDLAGRHLAVERGAQALELSKELEAQLVLGVAARVEQVPAARDADDERAERERRASSRPGATRRRGRRRRPRRWRPWTASRCGSSRTGTPRAPACPRRTAARGGGTVRPASSGTRWPGRCSPRRRLLGSPGSPSNRHAPSDIDARIGPSVVHGAVTSGPEWVFGESSRDAAVRALRPREPGCSPRGARRADPA